MTTLAQDTFIRANQSGFGTSSGGDVWGAPIGVGAANITTNEGVLSGGNGGDVEVVLGSQTAGAINMLLRTASSDTSNLNGLLWRFTNTSGGNGYRCGFDTFFGASGGFGIDKYVNGSRSNVGSFAAGVVINPNEFWWIRLIHDASNLLQIRVWKDGNAEPGTWNFSQTDASFTSGNFGVAAFLRTGTTISYDHLTVTNNQSVMPLITQAQTKFFIKANLQTQVRLKFLVRLKLGTQAQTKFLVRLVLKTQSDAKFFVRSIMQTQARATFLIRLKLATQARAKFVIRLALKTQSRSKFLINQVINPLKQFKLSFVSQSKYKLKFSEAALVLPNSTTQSSATATDASGNLQAALTGSVTVYYPGGIANSGPLTPVNAGTGVYTLTYVTLGPGIYRELWSFSDGAGNVVTDLNEISCAY